MLNWLLQKENKITYKNTTYSIDQFDSSLLERIIKSRFASEGTFAIEQLTNEGESHLTLTTPSLEKFDFQTTDRSVEEYILEGKIYQLSLSKHYYLPLFTGVTVDILNVLEETQCDTFTQILITKSSNWREEAIVRYENYLNGIDSPIGVKVLDKIQSKLVGALGKISNTEFKRQQFEEIEQKILQNGYQMEIRIVLLDGSETELERFITNKLSKTDMFNSLELVTAEESISKHIQDMTFQPTMKQIFSEQEVCSILSNVESITVPVETMKLNESPVSANTNELLNRAIDFLPSYPRKEEKITEDTIVSLQSAFKRVKITDTDIKILSSFQGATLNRFQIEIPENVNYSNIQKNLTNLQAAMGDESVSIEIGDQPNTFNLYMPRINRDIIWLKDILQSDVFKNHLSKSELPIILGEKTSGEIELACLADLKHLLIAGATGSGKSVFLNILIIVLLLSVDPELLNVILIDPKQVEFEQYKDFPQVSNVITDPEEAVSMVESLCVEMEMRYKEFTRLKVKNIQQYNRKSNVKMPYIVTVIDEYADLMMQNKDVEDHVVRLSQKSRAAGIHVVLATQKPLSTIVTSVLKSNLPSAISFRLKTSSDYKTVFGGGVPFNLLGKGDGVAKLEGQIKEFERFQSPVITLDENEEELIYGNLLEHFKDAKKQVPVDIVEEEKPIEKLKKIIANTGETKLGVLREQMKIRMNDVTDLIKELVEEGWLEKQGKGYVVVAEENELSKWRDH
ncbi:FtsK/SpoIIIE domain-containing protein [Cytobacillus gottheilii]|uniref:FtsK/SpoIIIE domain-containing protein n=1 Tax=Cytobacillus gottheilii TaxID=859144 RepID=UPI0009B9C014|nr:FtsK/SpoIIIE domain-containing protein [Cytobacillus gottheilii]